MLRQVNKNQKPFLFLVVTLRVNPENIFKAEIGDFFIHRNIANIVPPFNKEL